SPVWKIPEPSFAFRPLRNDLGARVGIYCDPVLVLVASPARLVGCPLGRADPSELYARPRGCGPPRPPCPRRFRPSTGVFNGSLCFSGEQPESDRYAATVPGFAFPGHPRADKSFTGAQYLHDNILANPRDAIRLGRELDLGEFNVLAEDIAYGTARIGPSRGQ